MLYVADAFVVMAKANELLAKKQRAHRALPRVRGLASTTVWPRPSGLDTCAEHLQELGEPVGVGGSGRSGDQILVDHRLVDGHFGVVAAGGANLWSTRRGTGDHAPANDICRASGSGGIRTIRFPDHRIGELSRGAILPRPEQRGLPRILVRGVNALRRKPRFPTASTFGATGRCAALFLLDGEGELRFGDKRYPLRKHDVIACPTGGPDVAHQIINTGTTTMRYLALSNVVEIDTCEYPDSNKVMVATGRHGERVLRKMFRSENTVEYYDRESTEPPKRDG